MITGIGWIFVVIFALIVVYFLFAYWQLDRIDKTLKKFSDDIAAGVYDEQLREIARQRNQDDFAIKRK